MAQAAAQDEAVWWQIARLTDGQTNEQTVWLCVCWLIWLEYSCMHFIVIKARAARGAACLLLRLVICAINTIVQPIKRGDWLPVPRPHLLHSLGACHDGSNQTFYTCPTTTATTTRSTAGVKWRVAASGGKWQVAALLSICISSSSSGSPCRRRLLLLTDSWHKLTSKRYLKRPSILCEPVAIGIEWAAGQSSMLPHFASPRPALLSLGNCITRTSWRNDGQKWLARAAC